MADKIHLERDKETYLATLYGKALDARVPDPILGDVLAADAVDRIDFDFTTLKLPSGGEVTLPMRARHFDRWTRAFLAANPEAVVLHLGCGLDTRVYRVDPGPGVSWYDVDFPDVLALRERLYPPRPGYRMIGTSVTALAWLDEVAADRPVIAVGEGLVMYLPEDQGTALFRRLTERFPRGELAFDGYSASMVRLVSRLATVRGAEVELVWGLGDARDLERAVPGLRLVEEVSFLGDPELTTRMAKNRVSAAMYRMIQSWGWYRNLVRHVRYAFGSR